MSPRELEELERTSAENQTAPRARVRSASAGHVCDCGQRFASLDGLTACQSRRHRGSAYLEAVDALEATPEELPDADWHAARHELDRIRE